MKNIPILFKTEMVNAILSGSKTQTRRIVKGDAVKWLDNNNPLVEGFLTPYQVGDTLWVKETFQYVIYPNGITDNVMYKADGEIRRLPEGSVKWNQDVYVPTAHNIKWRPSLFMPRFASRINLQITGVRVERLNDISEADAIAEGIKGEYFPSIGTGTMFYKDYLNGKFGLIPSASYRTLWESINGVGSWELNPWVWVIEFKKCA